MNLSFCHGIVGHIFMLDKIQRIFPSLEIKNSIFYWEGVLNKLLKSDDGYNFDHFYPKGIVTGKSGLGILAMQRLNYEIIGIDKVFLLDLEYFQN